MNSRRKGRAVNKGFARGSSQEIVPFSKENGAHRIIIGDDGEDNIGGSGHLGEGLAVPGSQLLRDFGGSVLVHVIDRGDIVTAVQLKMTGHIGSHAADADECYFTHNFI